MLRTLGLAGLVTVIAAPVPFFDMLSVLRSAGSTVNSGVPVYESLERALGWRNLPLTLAIFDTGFLQDRAGAAMAVACGLALLVAVLASPRAVWGRNLGLVCGCVALLLGFRARSYDYGVMKSIEFLALPLAPLFAAGVLRLVAAAGKGGRSRLAAAGAGACALVAATVWCSATVARSVSFFDLTRQKHLSVQLRELEQASSRLGQAPVVFVSGDLGGHGFMASRWIAYLMRSVPLVFSRELHPGGYIYDLDSGFNGHFERVTHVLRAVFSFGEGGTNPSPGKFELVPAGNGVALFHDGFHGNEGGYRWMSQKGVLIVFGEKNRTLRVEVVGRFPESREQDALYVCIDGRPDQRVELSGGKGAFEVGLTGDGPVAVTLRSAVAAVSPRSLGLSGDSRELSFAIGSVSARPAAAGPDPAQRRTACMPEKCNTHGCLQ